MLTNQNEVKDELDIYCEELIEKHRRQNIQWWVFTAVMVVSLIVAGILV